MKKLDFHALSNREKHNREVLERMKTGDPLQRYSSEASWFPPRPIVKKDENALKLLYKEKKKHDVIQGFRKD